MKEIYSLNSFKKQYLLEKTFNREESSEIKASHHTTTLFFFLGQPLSKLITSLLS